MLILLKAIGILFVFESLLILIRPDLVRKIITFFSMGKRVYLAGLMRFVLAVIFFFAASGAAHPWIVIAMGILVLAGGISCFTLKRETMQKMFAWWLAKPDIILRLLSVVALAFGALVIYSS